MSDLDTRALDANFARWKSERASSMPDDQAFERYSVDQALRDRDLSDEEIDSGILGGADDGGVDAMYFFIGDQLVRDDATEYPSAETVELVLLQATREQSFKEARIEKFHSFCRVLLDYSKPVDQIGYLNSMVKDAIARFRAQYDRVLGDTPTLLVTFHYVCRSTSEPQTGDKVRQRAADLTAFVRERISDANATVQYWSSQKLLAAARRSPSKTVVLPTVQIFQTSDKCAVCLVRLLDYAKHLLTTDDGKLNTRIFEPNVRDYQGARNPVNEDIRATLRDASPKEDFWWLNNGITIVASSCSRSGDKITIGDPEVVNGLQTSHEIFSHLPPEGDTRSILVRIIIPEDERSRTRVIKATNSQTQVKDMSLRANDPIHLDIEDRLKLYSLFYDRRKGEYKRKKKPLAQIIGAETLAQTVVAIALQKPDEARARPLTFLRENYQKIFDEAYDRDLYAACILIDRQVGPYMENEALSRDEKRDLRYYVDAIVSSLLVGKAHPSAADVAALAKRCVSPIEPVILEQAADIAITVYKKQGATDKAAKSAAMRAEAAVALESLLGKPEAPANERE